MILKTRRGKKTPTGNMLGEAGNSEVASLSKKGVQ